MVFVAGPWHRRAYCVGSARDKVRGWRRVEHFPSPDRASLRGMAIPNYDLARRYTTTAPLSIQSETKHAPIPSLDPVLSTPWSEIVSAEGAILAGRCDTADSSRHRPSPRATVDASRETRALLSVDTLRNTEMRGWSDWRLSTVEEQPDWGLSTVEEQPDWGLSTVEEQPDWRLSTGEEQTDLRLSQENGLSSGVHLWPHCYSYLFAKERKRVERNNLVSRNRR